MRAARTRFIKFALITCASLALAAPRAAAATLTGTVVDSAGSPIAGARVDIASAGPKIGPGIFCPTCYVDCAKHTTTDAAGKFEIRALSDALKFRVLAFADGRRTHITDLVDPAVRPLKLTLADAPRDVPATRTVRGIVVDEQDNPIEGALVSPGGAEMGSRRWWGRVDDVDPVVTNAEGRFAMFVPEGMTAVDLSIEADGLAGATTELTPAGAEAARIVVPRGARVTGRLVGDDGPRAGAQIAVVQIERTAGTHFIAAVAATADAEGRFEMSALPAAQEYAIFSPVGQGLGDGWVIASRRLRVGDSGSVRDIGELRVRRGLKFAGRLASQTDAPRPRGIKLSLGRNPAWDLIELPVDDQGRFELTSLPAESYTVRVMAPGWGLVADELPFQVLDENSFGVPLAESLEDLTIPLRPVGSESAHVADEDVSAAAAPQADAEIAATTNGESTAGNVGGGAMPVTRTAEPTPRDGPQFNLAGRVVDEAGAPIANATVMLRAKLGGRQYVWGVAHNRDILATTRTNRVGRFLLPNIAVPLRMDEILSELSLGRPAVELLVLAEGCGLKWLDVASFDPQLDMQLTLEPEADLRGTVRTADGRPVAGALVESWGLTRARDSYDGMFRARGELNLLRCEFNLRAAADAEGNFVLKNVPRDYRVALAGHGEGFQFTTVFVDTAADAQPREINSSLDGRGEALPVFVSPLEIELHSAPMLRVRVVHSTGEPVAGGGLMLVDAQRHYAGEAEVGADGTAAIPLHATGRIDVYYEADPLTPGLGNTASVDVAPGQQEIDLEIRTPEERWLEGRVIDADDGVGVPGIYVSYGARDRPEGQSVNSTAISGADGRFRIPTTVGRGALNVRLGAFGYCPPIYMNRANNAPDDESLAVEAPADGDPAPVELKLAKGLVIHGRVATADDKPLGGARVLVQTTDRPLQTVGTITDNDGWFTVAGVSPHVNATVTIAGESAAVQETVVGDPKHPWDSTRRVKVNLTAERGLTLAGRVLRRGQPAPGVRMLLYRGSADPAGRSYLFAEYTTDREGKYAFPGMMPGDRYYFEVQAPDRARDPAWTHQMPYLQTVEHEPDGVVELPDVNLVAAGQTLAGIVVDPAGQPVAGATVSAQLQNGQSVPRPREGPPPWMTTEADGRFSLADLPDAPLALMAYVANPAGGRIHFPARVAPRPNQTDVRIVLDPRLSADLPEL